MNMEVLMPLTAVAIAIIGLGLVYYINKSGVLNKSSNKVTGESVHDFINVRDIKGNFLYTNDNKICGYFRINPISIGLYSDREKKSLCQQLTNHLASENKPFKFIAVSRPVDITPLISEYGSIVEQTESTVIKDILKNEMLVMTNYAHSGEVVQRQFYFMIWEDYKKDIERDFLKRLEEFKFKFTQSRLSGDILKQHEIVRLCNLVNNPAYTNIEETDTDANIPMIMELYKNNESIE